MTDNNEQITEAQVLQQMIAGLSPLDDDARLRLLETVSRFFDLSLAGRARTSPISAPTTATPDDDFDAAAEQSPKAFLFEKNPRTLLERVACLAYYLTHYRDTHHFKTLDISKLNTEAAQTKFSNTAQSVADAMRAGLLAAASRGNKQLSALGEEYVKALPDREQARAVMKRMRPRKPRKKSTPSKNKKQ
jgi:hypothetical protein